MDNLTAIFHKYFDLNEFDSPDIPGSGMFMNPDFLNKLAKARDIANVPFTINSGYRTLAYNRGLIARGIPASPNSSHILGLAADISCRTDRMRSAIISALLLSGFRRIGIGKTFIHVDLDENKTQDVIWVY